MSWLDQWKLLILFNYSGCDSFYFHFVCLDVEAKGELAILKKKDVMNSQEAHIE